MGSWGSGAFDNDAAQDWVDDYIKAKDKRRLVIETLDDQDARIDERVAAAAAAAAAKAGIADFSALCGVRYLDDGVQTVAIDVTCLRDKHDDEALWARARAVLKEARAGQQIWDGSGRTTSSAGSAKSTESPASLENHETQDRTVGGAARGAQRVLAHAVVDLRRPPRRPDLLAPRPLPPGLPPQGGAVTTWLLEHAYGLLARAEGRLFEARTALKRALIGREWEELRPRLLEVLMQENVVPTAVHLVLSTDPECGELEAHVRVWTADNPYANGIKAHRDLVDRVQRALPRRACRNRIQFVDIAGPSDEVLGPEWEPGIVEE